MFVIAHDNPFNREVLGDEGWYFGSTTELNDRIREFGRLPAMSVLRLSSRIILGLKTYTAGKLWPIATRSYFLQSIACKIKLDVKEGNEPSFYL